MSWVDKLREILAPEPAPFWADLAEQRALVKEMALPKPRLAVVNSAPGREEFAAWRDDPVTLFVFAALRNAAAEQKQAWDDVAWHGGEANEKLLTELRTRADAYESLDAGDYEDFCAWAGVEPEGINNDAA